MAIITVGTSTQALATAYSNGRHIVKSSNGTLVLFAYTSDTTLAYKTSADDGATWSGSWTNVETNSIISSHIDACINGSDDIYLTYIMHDGSNTKLAFRKLTHSSGTWSVGARVYIVTSFPVGGAKPHSFAFRSNGDLWVTQFYNAKLYGYYSTNDGANWSSTDVASTNERISYTYQYGSNIRAVTQRDSRLTVYEYTSSWDAGTDIVTSGITDDNNGLGGLRISDSEIYVVARTSSGIKVFVWNGSSWDGGTLLSNHANDTQPTIASVNGKAVVTWKDFDGTYYNIAYRKWNGSSWDAQVDLMADAGVDSFPTSAIYDVNNLYVCWTTGASNPYTVYFTSVQLNTTKTQLINSDAQFVDQYQDTILSDAKFADLYQQTILSDILITALALYNIDNKINTLKQIFSDIVNKINTAIQSVSNVGNFINTCKSILSHINNDVRTKKLTMNNVANDIRFLLSWQKASNGAMQSLGKTYITISIAGVLQTDVDVDSITIEKTLNTAHTATFDLARAYDATKPTMESTVVIKYNNWILYNGYITQISPAEDPEKIRISCQDEYWKQNRVNKDYHVGHKPADTTETYYDTSILALTTEHSWTPNLGNFIPETIDNVDTGTSDALTKLILESGNYSWFYDVDGSKRLWTAGMGSIIEIKRQTLGRNIGLYDLINHSFLEDASNVVNRFRVQMGDKVIRQLTSKGGTTYTHANYYSYNWFYAVPAWDSSLEQLTYSGAEGSYAQSPDGILIPLGARQYGFNYHDPALDYSDVFTKYFLPYLDPKIANWSDERPPSVGIYYGGSPYIIGRPEGGLKTGFSVDYENGILTLSPACYKYTVDDKGNWTSVRGPIVKLYLYKVNYATFTYNPPEIPDANNPLEFMTAKMGVYSETITKDLNLSNLSIQIGAGTGNDIDGIQDPSIFIPSWDDTDFAKDFADWELSKVCDKKITGTINLTLDSTCFNGVDLSKRIFIDGITDEAMNIVSMSYNVSSFTVTISLENSRYYNRTVSLPSHESLGAIVQ